MVWVHVVPWEVVTEGRQDPFTAAYYRRDPNPGLEVHMHMHEPCRIRLCSNGTRLLRIFASCCEVLVTRSG